MNNTRSLPSSVLALLAVAFAPLAGAQVTGAVSGAVNGAASAVTQPVTPPPAPTVPPVTPAAPTVPPPSAPSVVGSGSGSMSAGATVSNGTIGANAAANVAGTGETSLTPTGRLNVDTLAAMGASGSLDSTATLSQIRQTEMAARNDVMSDLSTRINASARAVRELEQRAARLAAPARQEFNAALQELRAKERALNSSLTAARSARTEAWMDARSTLATDFDAYAKAVARAEAALGSMPATPAVPATPAIPARPGLPGTPATPAVPATPGSAAIPSANASGSVSADADASTK